MARRGLSGQLNMFDFFSSMDDQPMGEVEMVSLMPTFDEPMEKVEEVEPAEETKVNDAEITVISETIDNSKVVMSRKYELDGQVYEIAYMNYNKVRISNGQNPPQIHEFDTSKEAVDYYVEKMQEMETDE